MCRICERALAQNVAQGEALVDDLRVTAEKLDRTGKPGPLGSGSKTPPLPVRLDAAKLAVSLERHLAANGAGSLVERAARAATADWGPSWHARLEGLIVKAVAKVDLPPEWIRLGACGGLFGDDPDDLVPCDNELAVPAGSYEVTCEVCGTWYDVAERQDAKIASAWDAVATPPVIVRALGTQGIRLEVKHIENWAQLGHIGRLCDLVTGAEGYRIGEVHAVALRMAERRRRAAERRGQSTGERIGA
jgi:hypothetical protein